MTDNPTPRPPDAERLENDIRELRGAKPGELAARLIERGWTLDADRASRERAAPEGLGEALDRLDAMTWDDAQPYEPVPGVDGLVAHGVHFATGYIRAALAEAAPTRQSDEGRLREAVQGLIEAAIDSETHQHLDGPDCVPAVTTDDLRAALAAHPTLSSTEGLDDAIAFAVEYIDWDANDMEAVRHYRDVLRAALARLVPAHPSEDV